MRTAETDILIVPGLGGSGPGHWQTRWEGRLSTAHRLEGVDFDHPTPEAYRAALRGAVAAASKSMVLVAHSLGVLAVVHAAPDLAGTVRGAYLVAPPDAERPDMPPGVPAFAPIPSDPLPFPSVLAASADDPWCTPDRAADFAAAWGSAFVEAGTAGHINVESGHGPWPEGLMSFAGFLSKLPG